MCVVLSNSERNLIIIKEERLVKVDDLDCDAIRMLQQIFSEILNALNVSVQERKCNLQSTVFSEEKYASKSGLLIKSLRLEISELRNYCTKIKILIQKN